MKQKFAYLRYGTEFVSNFKVYTKIDERHAVDRYGKLVTFNTRDTVETDLETLKQKKKTAPKVPDFESIDITQVSGWID